MVLQPPPRPTVLLEADREDRTLVSAVEAVTEILAVPRLDRIGKDFEHRVALARARDLPTGANNERNVFSTAVLNKSCAKRYSRSLAARNTSSRSLGSQDSRIDRSPRESRMENCRSLSVCQMTLTRYRAVFTHAVSIVTK